MADGRGFLFGLSVVKGVIRVCFLEQGLNVSLFCGHCGCSGLLISAEWQPAFFFLFVHSILSGLCVLCERVIGICVCYVER